MKERLTGAIILVALIVLVVPELLTGPPRLKSAAQPSARAAVSAAGHTPVQAYTLPLGAQAPTAALRAVKPEHDAAVPTEAASRPSTPASPGPATRSQATARTPRVHPAAAAPKVKPAGPRASASRHRAKPPVRHETRALPDRRPARATVRRRPAGARWIVQLGVFAVHADALRLQRRVRSKGFSTELSRLHLGGRVLWRVSAGSEPTRAAALSLARRLHRAGVRSALLRQ